MDQFQEENPLYLSWHDSVWLSNLNANNVLDYFCQESNPFYDKNCNNEIIKTQNRHISQLECLTGIEFVLLHVQEPILYVIRKQNRLSPTEVLPVANYYIIAGIVYQCPDLNTVLNMRLINAISHLSSAFSNIKNCVCYSSAQGYFWDFSKNNFEAKTPEDSTTSISNKEFKVPSHFQAYRVDNLLTDLIRRYPTGTHPPNEVQH